MPGDKGELELTVHHRSDTGRVRDHNEDYLGYRQPKDSEMRAEAGWLYDVADGVGGAQAGEVASKLAVQTLLTAYYRAYQEAPSERLLAVFAEANHAVYDQAGRQEGPHSMGTTLVAAALRGRELTVANVGDSRAYLIHRGQIRQITHDHSMVARLIDEGVITPEQAESHPRRHVLSRSIGAYPQVAADLFTETMHPGDRLLLCTDGLTEYVADTEILATVQAEDPEAGVQRLVELANERGGKDNITVLLVRALGEREERLPPLPPPQKTVEGPALSPVEGPPPRRSSWLWVGAILFCLLICAAGLAAGAFLLKPTPTPTPTATTIPLPPFADATASATAAPTPTALPTATDTVLPTETPTLVSTEPPTASDTPSPTGTPTPSRTPTNTPSPTHTKTASPAPTQTPLTPTDTASPRLTETATLTPTATSTSEISALPTPTDTLPPTPTPTGTTERSPLPTPRP
ncbi:MAG: Stp1/IreP family PP2C-type Ser/Thr phosphatase [Anaerolineae bacterium]|nr:MAG: Stp1/IreP family PP2C-type Ser/Thr phosphatase [Anaerolineae bacterium]